MPDEPHSLRPTPRNLQPLSQLLEHVVPRVLAPSSLVLPQVSGHAGAIRTATSADLLFVQSLAAKHSNAVGFLPRQALEWYCSTHHVLIADENSDEAGYLLGRTHLRWCIAIRPITQAAVCFDAQRRHHGLSLVARTAVDARQAGQLAIQACCRQGLDANAFWLAAGFEAVCQLNPANQRRRNIIVWRKQLTPFRPAWFASPPTVAGWRAKRTP